MQRVMQGRAIKVIALVLFCGLLVTSGVVAIGILRNLTFAHELESKIVGFNGHILVQGTDAPLDDYDGLCIQLQKLPGVALTIPFIEFAAGVSSERQQTGALVRGVRANDLRRWPAWAGHVVSGTLDEFDGAGGVAIGQGLADALGVGVGDTISILTAMGPVASRKPQPRIKSYPVVATLQMGMTQFDNVFIFMPLSEAQAFSEHEGEVTVIEIFLTDAEHIDVVRTEIDTAARRPLVLTDWRERNKTFFATLQTEYRRMTLVFCLLLAALAGIAAVVWQLFAFRRASFPPQA